MKLENTKSVISSASPVQLVLLAFVLFMWAQSFFIGAYRAGIHAMITYSRTARDHLNVTPFANVVVRRTALQSDGSILIWGELEKLACKRNEIFAFTRDTAGLLHYAVFESLENPANTPPNRPILKGQQAFGPWRIMPLDTGAPIADGVMVVSHDCADPAAPGETLTVLNTVFDVPWATTATPQRQEATFNVSPE